MNHKISIKSADDKNLPIYVSEPKGIRKGAIVINQEIFGVNNHIKSVANKFAEEGFIVWSPEIYHRLGEEIQLGYDENSVTEGKKLKDKSGWELPVMDILSCVANLKIENSNVSLLGFCYGGSLAWKSACQGYGISSSVCFYGSQITDFLKLNNKCPVQIHLGEKDISINLKQQQNILNYSKKSKQLVEIHKYKEADHGFFCEERKSFHKNSAEIAFSRSVDFISKFQQ